jgi:hypothetical protein
VLLPLQMMTDERRPDDIGDDNRPVKRAEHRLNVCQTVDE